MAITEKGRGYLWNWPDQEHKAFVISRENSWFEGFSPDSKWFVNSGLEFIQIFQTDPLVRIARLQSKSGYTAVDVASNNLIVMGDRNGYIYNIAAGKMISHRKVCEYAVGPLKLYPKKGYLWAGSSLYYYRSQKSDKAEIALYHINGLEPYIDPEDIAREK